MTTPTTEIKVQRTIAAAPAAVFAAWLDPTVPGAFGNGHAKLIVDLRVDGLWYWLTPDGTPHFGRFLDISRPRRLQHSWMSPNTLGQESTVTVTFEPAGSGTQMTIVHSGLPDEALAKAHEGGWEGIMDAFTAGFAAPSNRAHSAAARA